MMMGGSETRILKLDSPLLLKPDVDKARAYLEMEFDRYSVVTYKPEILT